MGRRGFYRAGWLRAVARWATAGVALPVLALLVINQDPPAVAAVPPPSAAVTDPIAAYYQQLGGPSSYLGNPIGAEYPVAGGEGQDFAGGSIYYSSATGPHAVHGAILGHYRALGGPAGLLGFPTSDETGVPDGVGRFNTFAGGAGGAIYWTASTGAWSVHGAIYAKWASMGWERSVLGYPTSDEYAIPGGRRSNFVSGTISWDAATGATTVTLTGPSLGQRAAQVAQAQEGKPYEYGGAGPNSFDCSGLTRYSWLPEGVDLPHNALQQYQITGRIAQTQLEPGDLVFYDTGDGGPQPGHVAIYVGNDEVVAANSPGTYVQRQSITYDGIPRWFGRVPTPGSASAPAVTAPPAGNGATNIPPPAAPPPTNLPTC